MGERRKACQSVWYGAKSRKQSKFILGKHIAYRLATLTLERMAPHSKEPLQFWLGTN